MLKLLQWLTHIQINAGLELELQNRTSTINQLHVPNMQRSTYSGKLETVMITCCTLTSMYFGLAVPGFEIFCCKMRLPVPVHQRNQWGDSYWHGSTVVASLLAFIKLVNIFHESPGTKFSNPIFCNALNFLATEFCVHKTAVHKYMDRDR